MNIHFEWQSPERLCAPAAGDIIVLRKRVEAAQRDQYWPLLNLKEKARAERFVLPHDRARFIVARGWLRTALGQAISVRPQDIVFDYQANGKPSISMEQNPQHISFNLSHSQECIVLGIAHGVDIGIDVEFARDNIHFMEVAERFFHVDEVRALRELTLPLQKKMFYELWTQKEALVKLHGGKLMTGLPRNIQNEIEKNECCLQLFNPFENYAGAIAVSKNSDN